MKRACAAIAAGLWLAASAFGQGADSTIQWISDPARGVAAAKKADKLVLFWVPGSSTENDSKLENAQSRVFRDPLVKSIVAERFVPTRLSRSSDNAATFQKLGLPQDYGLYLAVVNPQDGTLVDRITAEAVADEHTLATKLTEAYRSRGQSAFDAYAKQLEAAEVEPGVVEAAIGVVDRYTVTGADNSLIKLLENSRLSDALRKRIFDTLAKLSTKEAVAALLQNAKDSKAAADALMKIEPGGAAHLLEAIAGEDPELMLIAYKAAAKATKLPSPKVDRFFSGKNERAINEEKQRVIQHVRRVAARWEETIGLYR